MISFLLKSDYIEKFESLVNKRFETLEKLEKYLIKEFKPINELKLEFSYNNYEKDFPHDWNILCLIENIDIYCDLDIYFLYDRYQNLYITEVGYEFSMNDNKNNTFF